MTDDKDGGNSRVPLRDYLEIRVAAVEKGISVAHKEMERRLEGMNEFREQLRNQAALFVTRTESEAKMGSLEDRLTAKMEFLAGKVEDSMKSKVSRGTAVAIAALCSLALSLIVYVVTKGG